MWGVIWFDFHVLQFLPIRFPQQHWCCISKSMIKHLHKPDWKSGLLWFRYGYWKCMLVDFSTMYIGPFDCVRYECRVIISIWRCSPCLLFDPHRTPYRLNIGVWLRNKPLKTHLPYIFMRIWCLRVLVIVLYALLNLVFYNVDLE